MHVLDTLYRRDLVDAVLAGRLIGFRCWLECMAGSEWDGHWQPANALDSDHCWEVIETLSSKQLDELSWRGLIPLRDQEVTVLLWSEEAIIQPLPKGGYVLDDPIWEQVIYGLSNGQRIRLRVGELELLKAAGYPTTWEEVLHVLWRHIGSRKHDPDSLGERLRKIGALLYSDATRDVVDLVSQLRTLVPPPSARDGDIARVVLAERTALECAFSAVIVDGWPDSDLATALRELEAAQNALTVRR